MTRAAHAIWRALRQRWPAAGAITVLAGRGNNAGDGYLIAALALRAGWQVQVLAVGDPAEEIVESGSLYRVIVVTDEGRSRLERVLRGSTATEVVRKAVNPPWRPTASMLERNPDWPKMVEGGAPDNPLGVRGLYLSWPAYLIHGTHDTRKIGRRSSNGCIGLYNEHVIELYDIAQVGTQVLLI